MNKDLIIRQLCEDVADLKRRVAAMPVVVSPYLPSQVFMVIDRGNTLDSGQFGVKYVAGPITNVPLAYDPNVTSTFIDGIGRGTLYRNGVAQAGYVLICNDSGGSFRNALLQNDVGWAFGTVILLVGAGPATVTAYRVG